MKRLLIVDDEQWIRKGIAAKAGGYPIGEFEILEAENGQEALDVIRHQKVDIVITDVQMPVMNGLELSRQLYQNPEFSHIQVMIISGFAEFEYARKAIAYGVHAYLLKPVKKEELYQELANCIKVITAEEEKKLNPKSRELNHWLRGENHQSLPEAKAYQLMMVHHKGEDDLDQVRHKVMGVIRTYSERIKHSKVSWVVGDSYRSGHQQLILAYGQDASEVEKAVNRVSIKLFDAVKALSIAIGLSHVDSVVGTELYKTAYGCLTNRLIKGYGKVYKPGKDPLTKEGAVDERIQLLKQYVNQGRQKKINKAIDEIFVEEHFGNHVVLERCWIEVISLLDIRAALNMGDELLSKQVLNRFDTLQDLRHYLAEKTELLLGQGEGDGDREDLMTKVLNYIDLHYFEELMVKSVAEKFSVNANYLSGVFKKATGLSFTGYLTELRIDNACRLLKESDSSVAEVAVAVGYQDPQYFYRVFKKQVGVTPLKYRKNL